MNPSIPITDVVLSAAKKQKPGVDQLRSFAAGIMAHIAIQTLYRIQHPDHFVITERLVSFGDARIGTLSKFGDLLANGRRLAALARKAGMRPVSRKIRKALKTDDLWSLLVLLIDLSTDLTQKGKTSRKRYDIIDFGPLATSAIWPVSTAQAYEIKSVNEIERGANYVATQTAAFNETVRELASTFQNLFDVEGLSGYRATPGRSWPSFAYVLPVGPNLLHFFLAQPGVIAYEWLKFKQVSLKEIWKLVRKTADLVRELYKREESLDSEVRSLATIMAALAVVVAGVAAVELVGTLAIAEGAAALAGRQLLSRAVLGGAFITTPAMAGELEQSKLLKAIADATDLGSDELSSDNGALVNPNGGQSGGTGPTQTEAAVEKLSRTIAEQFISIYAVQRGQGEEILDDSATQMVKRSVADWFGRFLNQYGIEEFERLFGIDELNDETAFEIAQTIVTNGNLFVERYSYGDFFTTLVTMPLQDIVDSLPEGYNADGEIDEPEDTGSPTE